MDDVDAIALLARQELRDRRPALLAEVCAWAVGLSDRPHLQRRAGRLSSTGETLGLRAEAGRTSAAELDGRVDLGDAAAGTFADAVAALAPDGRPWADLLEEQVLVPFVLQTCVLACQRARQTLPDVWEGLLDELGEDGSDLEEVVRGAEWEVPLRVEAEQAVLAALGPQPLVEVEAEGLPLSLVRAAEAVTRGAAPTTGPDVRPDDEEIAGALFLAEAAVAEVDLTGPPLQAAEAVLEVLLEEGLMPEELPRVLPHLPVPVGVLEELEGAVAQLLEERG